jgi:hypothetical protein
VSTVIVVVASVDVVAVVVVVASVDVVAVVGGLWWTMMMLLKS